MAASTEVPRPMGHLIQGFPAGQRHRSGQPLGRSGRREGSPQPAPGDCSPQIDGAV